MTPMTAASIVPNLSVECLKTIVSAIQASPAQDSDGRRPGAVMTIFLESGGEPALLFTKRAAHLDEHAGQISFPGGAVEEYDPDFQAAAFRETFEEVSIRPEELEILSPLPRQPVLETWMIHPFAAWWPAPRPLAYDPVEVARVIIHPLSDLMRQHQRECWLVPGPEVCRYELGGEILWGATARIAARLLDYIISAIELDRA
ncbi:hypothetical protein C4J81_14875 [Deltaproteobacteria bacterium Smac51]|nr:hypothetical protein C4J81_14875 [Deltaproteobacteria bacterium Smac51]